MIANTDWVGIAGVVVPITVSIFGGGLAMAWRLGGLERTVKDLADDVHGLDRKVDTIDTRTSTAMIAAGIARNPSMRTRESDKEPV